MIFRDGKRSIFILIKPAIFMLLPIIMSMGIPTRAMQSVSLSYGSYINQVHIANSDGTEIVVPQKGVVSILYFFNINNIVHDNVLNNINFLIMNLSKGEKIRLYGISRGEADTFEKITAKYNIAFDLINDREDRISSDFSYTCTSCIQIILIDRDCQIRYLSSSFDPIFLREVIQRYVE